MEYLRSLLGSTETAESTDQPAQETKAKKKSRYDPIKHKQWRLKNKDRICRYNTNRREKLNALRACVGYKVKRRTVVPDYAREYTKPIYERHNVKPDYSLHVPKPRIAKKPKVDRVQPNADSAAPSTVPRKRRRQPVPSEKQPRTKKIK